MSIKQVLMKEILRHHIAGIRVKYSNYTYHLYGILPLYTQTDVPSIHLTSRCILPQDLHLLPTIYKYVNPYNHYNDDG